MRYCCPCALSTPQLFLLIDVFCLRCLCEIEMRFTSRDETASSCSAIPTVSGAASGVLAPCSGYWLAGGCEYVSFELDQLSGRCSIDDSLVAK